MKQRVLRAAALALVLAAAGLFAQIHHAAYAQSLTTLSGTVFNGTSGADAPADLQVTLRYQAETGEVVERTTVTGEGGAFRFVELPSQGNPGYELTTMYLDVEYANRKLGEPLAEPLEITVYETTNDFTVLYLLDDTLALTAADRKNRQIQVLEAIKLRNSSDRTFQTDPLIDGPMNLLRFSLPEGASDLDVETSLPGGHILQVNLGFALTTPIPPGEHDILYVYRAPYNGSTLEYTPRFPMGVEMYRVMLPQGLAEGESPDMQAVATVTVGERTFVMLEAESIPAGERLTFTITGLPQPSLVQRAQNVGASDGFQRGVLPSLAGLVLVGLLGFTLVRRRRGSAAMASDADEVYEELVLAIATLDERFAAGEVEEGEYRLERADLMRRTREK